MALETFWICVNHRWGTPPEPCGARGEGDTGANAHTQKTPHHHPTLTTTRRELADRLAGPTEQADPDPADLCVWCDANKHERCRGADNCRCPCNQKEDK